MKYTFFALVLVFLMLGTSPIFANTQLSKENMGFGHPLPEEISFDPLDYTSGWFTYDNNLDGKVDHAVVLDEKGYKVLEAIDYDKNGIMDDFYFYAEGILIRQEIDQNGDQRIDLWVYLTQGIFVEGYERDSDYDGVIDVVKLYADE